MSKVLISEQYLNDIANAIRIKNGEDDFYYPSDMASAIMRITSANGLRFLSMVDINQDWKFKLISSVSDPSYDSILEAQSHYDDSSWDNVELPHDWSIERSFNPKSPGGYTCGFLDGGDAWYRKTLPSMSYLNGKRLILYFDGVYMESDIYMNGVLLKSNRNWYDPFWVDCTEHINLNSENTIAVFVRNRQPSTHWYSGSGIYRKVYIIVCEQFPISVKDIIVTTPNLAVENGGNVTTNLKINLVSSESETVPIKAEILKDGTVLSSEDDVFMIDVGDNQVIINLQVKNPVLWDIGNGVLYKAKIIIGSGDSAIYHTVSFGYRWFEFNATTGFWLNGRNIKIKGFCLHDTYTCLGAKANRSAIDRRFDALIRMGCNAIRTSHNTYSSEVLSVCAERGLLVFAELFDCWTHRKTVYDFGQYFSDNYASVITNVIRRDINNPAIIMWGAGNEIIHASKLDGAYTPKEASGILQNIIDAIHALDVSRPITMGDNTPTNSASRACMNLLDVIGINYGSASTYNSLFTDFPGKPIFGSEVACTYMIRGDYSYRSNSSNYDDVARDKGASIANTLHIHMDDPRLAGMFAWVGVDYFGEWRAYKQYPYRSSPKGPLDTALFEKDGFYLYQSVWTDKPMIHIIPMHWDWEDNTVVKVWIYSNCATVDLWLNGKNLGSVSKGVKYQYAYDVPFENGTLVANGYDANGTLIAQDVRYSSRRVPNKLVLLSDKSSVNINSDDLVFITCEIQDQNDVLIPTANNTVSFFADGGTVLGTDSGWVKDVEDMTGNTKKASYGKLLCVVKPNKKTGVLTVTATSNGLDSSTVTIIKTSVTTKQTPPAQVFINAENPPIKNYS